MCACMCVCAWGEVRCSVVIIVVLRGVTHLLLNRCDHFFMVVI